MTTLTHTGCIDSGARSPAARPRNLRGGRARCRTEFSPALGDGAAGPWPKNGRRRLPGVVPPPAPADPEVVVMRTSWMLSRRIPPAARDRDRPLGASILGRRACGAWLLAGAMGGRALGLRGCGAGGGDESAARPDPSVTATAPTRPTRTSTSTPTPTRTPTSAERPTPPTTRPATSAEALTPTSTPTAAATPASAESGGSGTLGWTLLIVLVAGLIIAGWLILRSRRNGAVDAQADALERDTRPTTGTQLPSVLTAETTGQRALSWPPLRAALSDLVRRWELLAEHA